MRNFPLKVMAVVMAALTWLTVHFSTNEQDRIGDIPVEVLLPDGWAVLDRSVEAVEATFRGSREDIALLGTRALSVEVDLKKVSMAGEQRVELSAKNIVYPGNARVTSIEPVTIVVTVDEQVSKKVAITPSFVGKPEGALKVEGSTVLPAEAVITGSRTLLEEIDQVLIEPIELTGRIQPFEVRVEVAPPGPDWVGRIEPDRVLVQVNLVERTAEKRFEDVPIHILYPNSRKPLMVVEPKVATVAIRGVEEVISALKADDIRLYADATGVEPGNKYEMSLKTQLPDGVELVDIIPAAINLDVGQ